MSNQEYRKEPPEPMTREARLAKARARIETERAKGKTVGDALNKFIAGHFELLGGKSLDSQIEGMMLVIDEGKIYRRQALAYYAEMEQWYAGKREREPYEPQKAAVSAATMVSASRQLEVLRERREKVFEDAEIRLANELENFDEMKKPKAAQSGEPGQTPPPEPPPTQPQPEKEATPTKGDKHAATAAA